jgi:hypothetical protein
MANKRQVRGMLAMVLAFGLVLAGCASTSGTQGYTYVFNITNYADVPVVRVELFSSPTAGKGIGTGNYSCNITKDSSLQVRITTDYNDWSWIAVYPTYPLQPGAAGVFGGSNGASFNPQDGLGPFNVEVRNEAVNITKAK